MNGKDNKEKSNECTRIHPFQTDPKKQWGRVLILDRITGKNSHLLGLIPKALCNFSELTVSCSLKPKGLWSRFMNDGISFIKDDQTLVEINGKA